MTLLYFIIGVIVFLLGVVCGHYKKHKRQDGVLNLYYENDGPPSMYLELGNNIDFIESGNELVFVVREVKY